MSKILLIGFMGSGKSTVAALLADVLGDQLAELDQLLLDRSEFDSITEIFLQENGEQLFRELEHQTLRQLLANEQSMVISTGGGIVVDPRNSALISSLETKTSRGDKQLRVIYLQTSFDQVCERLSAAGEAAKRPLFADRKQAAILHKTRAALYEKIAHNTVNTDDTTPAMITASIKKYIRTNE